MSSHEQTAKTIEQLLAEIGVTHSKSKISGCRTLTTDTGVVIDDMDAHYASHFYDCAQSAA